MKAAPFRYCRPDSLAEALELLRRYGDELRGVVQDAESLRIGAMTRHRDVEHSPLVARCVPLLSLAMRLPGACRPGRHSIVLRSR